MSRDPAAPRFLVLVLTRFLGAALTMAGVVISAGNSDYPQWLGYVLAATGLASFFFVPKALARRWRSPGE